MAGSGFHPLESITIPSLSSLLSHSTHVYGFDDGVLQFPPSAPPPYTLCIGLANTPVRGPSKVPTGSISTVIFGNSILGIGNDTISPVGGCGITSIGIMSIPR